MPEPFSWDKPLILLGELCRLAAEREPAERHLPADFESQTAAAETEHRDTQTRLCQACEQAREAIEAQHAALSKKATAGYRAEERAAEQGFAETLADLTRRHDDAEWSVENRWKSARWEANTVHEATKDQPGLQLKEVETQLETGWETLQGVYNRAVEVFRRRGLDDLVPQPGRIELPAGYDPLQHFQQCVASGRALAAKLEGPSSASWLEGIWPVVPFLLTWLAVVIPLILAFGLESPLWIVASLAIAVAVGSIMLLRIRSKVRVHGEVVSQGLQQALSEAGPARDAALHRARTESERLLAAMAAKLQADLAKADEAHRVAAAEVAQRKQREFQEFEATRQSRMSRLAAEKQRELAAIEAARVRQLQDLEEEYQREKTRIAQEHEIRTVQRREQFQNAWESMADRWCAGVARFDLLVQQMNLACERWFPRWDIVDWNRWTAPPGNPPPVRFGTWPVDLGQMKGGLPQDPRLCPTRTAFTLPALLPFPHHSAVLVKAPGTERRAALEVLQAAMLRMLAALPPAKVRFTILDPVGLGESFAAFMHLADFDEQLVTSRIWTEPAHIERRLADLTEHMENVLQAYLRNEYGSIHEYNAAAGEMAEPYRVLVVADFPANFSEQALRRLASIVASGPRCGVYTLMMFDPGLPRPREFRLADFEPYAFSLEVRGGRPVWDHPEFGPLPLAPDVPPLGEKLTSIVRSLGRRAKEVGKVEVPFTAIAPEEAEWWKADSRQGLSVPLGCVGATKMQRLELGRGTSQHVLVSGKTGSGKSTLLHVLISNIALRYGPDQVELYLVDFKKGVEFKAYARNRLPHARVVAVESEREFGLSVLERLDNELRVRGDLFRQRGVQDLAGFRAAYPEEKLPRAVLIVDEFQELFVEDDRIGQRAAQLLDRLVRQGRAFGLHVLLGSQTLAGNYSLPRSTLGQMAVRIALQCSEADAHLILSEENTAARLLTRPGEAIYNDANGLYEGNHPFQVVWLSDAEREGYLEQVAQLATERGIARDGLVVFEGNADADVRENQELESVLNCVGRPAASRPPRAWFGAPVAIQAPTSVEFPRQSGSNLLVVGHREEAALGVLASAVASIAAHQPPNRSDDGPAAPVFYLLDGSRRDAPEAAAWGRLLEALPHGVRVGSPRETAEVLNELVRLITLREDEGRDNDPAAFLIVYNLPRFPLLRKEDEYEFGSSEKPASPAKLFRRVLRDGPAQGIHTLVWCDTFNNVGRWFDRQALRDLEMRILFQMNAGDSSQLIDNPAAAQLGTHRALLYHEGLGQLEKFRPYRFPEEDWIKALSARLRAK